MGIPYAGPSTFDANDLVPRSYVDNRGAIVIDSDGDPQFVYGGISPGVGVDFRRQQPSASLTRTKVHPGVVSSLTITPDAPAFAGGQLQVTYDEAMAKRLMRTRGGKLTGRPGLEVVKQNLINGAEDCTTFQLSTRFSGTDIGIHLYFWEATDVQIWINGAPYTPLSVTWTGMASQFINIKMVDDDEYDLDILMGRGCGFVQWIVPTRSGIMEPPAQDEWAWISDSYGVGSYASGATTDPTFVGTVPTWMSKYLDLDLFNLGQGGTGYTIDANGFSTSPFGSTSRMNALRNNTSPNLKGLIVFGSANDQNGGSAAIKAAAKAMYAQVAADRGQQFPIVVYGVEPGSFNAAGIVNLDSVNEAIRQACAESPNVRKFIDMRAAPGLIYGTGYQGGETANGNADWAVSGDKIHLTRRGHKHVGRWCADEFLKAVVRQW